MLIAQHDFLPVVDARGGTSRRDRGCHSDAVASKDIEAVDTGNRRHSHGHVLQTAISIFTGAFLVLYRPRASTCSRGNRAVGTLARRWIKAA
jgi:hypothetical protein